MKAKTTLVLAALAAAALAGQAAAETASPPRECFYSGNIRGFSAVDDETVNFQVGGRNDIVQVKLFAPSNDLKFANGIALISRGGSYICSKFDATVVVPGVSTGIGAQRYPISSIRRLNPQEVAALPAKQRP
jgi:Family of unknown function (DUF6491)